MRLVLALVFTLFHGLFCTTVLHTKYGLVFGRLVAVDGTNAREFVTVPYAQSTHGANRFKLPIRVKAWNGTFDGTRPSSCYSILPFSPRTFSLESEDCLHLKVVLPEGKEDRLKIKGGSTPGNKSEKWKEESVKGRAAVVWIHGGSFAISNRHLYTTASIVRHFSSRDIAFISIDFRQGPWGFLSTPSLPPNLGLHDIISALQFIHENAELWGIDTKRITLAGESSGAAIAGILAVSPAAQGLISSIIEISGSPHAIWAVRNETTSNNTDKLLRALNCSTTAVLSCLQSIPALSYESTYQSLIRDQTFSPLNLYETAIMGYTYFTPVIDSWMGALSIIPVLPSQATPTLPLLLSTSNESVTTARYFVNLNVTKEEFISKASKGAGESEAVSRVLLHHYSSRWKSANLSTPEIDTLVVADYMNELGFLSPAHSEALRYASHNQTVYVMKINVQDKGPDEYYLATPHGAELVVLFDNIELSIVGFRSKNKDDPNYYDFDANQPEFRETYTKILGDFIKNHNVASLSSFTPESNIANSVSRNGVRTIQADSEAHSFWQWQVRFWRALSSYLRMESEAPNSKNTLELDVPEQTKC